MCRGSFEDHTPPAVRDSGSGTPLTVALMSSPSAVPKNQSPKFDALSFAMYMKNTGRAYRKRSMELISICRSFVQAGEQSVSQDADLRK